MTRKKVKLALVEDNSTRKRCFQKRRKGLKKKADELSTLCGVESCFVIFSPYSSQPYVWPSDERAQHAISRYQSRPLYGRDKKIMVETEAFAEKETTKAEEQLKKLQQENNNKIMYGIIKDRGSIESLKTNDLVSAYRAMSKRLEELNKRAWTLNQEMEMNVTNPRSTKRKNIAR